MSPSLQTIGRRRVLTLGAAMLATPFLARPGVAAVRGFGARAFGTEWRVTLPASAGADAVSGDIAAFLARTDRMMSPWRTDSELSRFNAAPAGGHAVSPETALVAAAALDLARNSGGAFDPSVGPLVARWGFGPIHDGQPGWQAMAAGDAMLDKTVRGATLDLCGLAKGWALDGMAKALAQAGHTAFLVDLGGELRAEGRHPDGRAWRVGVEDPRPLTDGLAATLALDGVAVATSGSKANGYTLGDHRYSHIIAPSTGAPVEDGPDQVSVIAADAMMADGWATALMAAGSDGPRLAEAHGLSALFLFAGETGVRRHMTGGFDRYLT